MRYIRAINNLQIIKLKKIVFIKLKRRVFKANNGELYI